MDTIRYNRALARNLAELQKALLIRATLLGIEEHKYTTNIFIRIIKESLSNDHMAHAIKVFEQNSKSASFWYLYRTNQVSIDKYARKVRYTISNLQSVSDKLKIIRNGTHFHIDKNGVLAPKQIWSGAALTGKELGKAIDFAWGALGEIQLSKGREVPSLLEFTPEIALAAIERIEKRKP